MQSRRDATSGEAVRARRLSACSHHPPRVRPHRVYCLPLLEYGSKRAAHTVFDQHKSTEGPDSGLMIGIAGYGGGDDERGVCVCDGGIFSKMVTRHKHPCSQTHVYTCHKRGRAKA
jgi:hypothetical protein